MDPELRYVVLLEEPLFNVALQAYDLNIPVEVRHGTLAAYVKDVPVWLT